MELFPPAYGMDVVLGVDGKLQPSRLYRSSDAVDARIRALKAAGHRAVLFAALSRKVRAPYRALVTVQRTRARRIPDALRLRLSWRPAVSDPWAPLPRLFDEAERAGLRLLRHEPTTAGAVELELACR